VEHDLVQPPGFVLGGLEFGDRAVADDAFELESPLARVVVVNMQRDVFLELKADPAVGFDELDPRVLPDMGVKVAFQEAVRSDVPPQQRVSGVLVPKSALRSRDGRDYVLIVNDGMVERRAVAAGDSHGSDILLSSGVAAGESVVLEGPAELLDGMRVREMQR